MAKTGSVWGIDLGQCALKALRCRAGDEPGTIVAEAFDFIEYPKMLGQPDANPAELMKEALDTFLSRNSVKGDKVAISVSGQSGLSRFIKLPPVETKKIPDIVKYEAKQQIPFQLEDVVWDYQQMAGGSVEEGFALEAEVGLFAMKRDQVARALRPYIEAGIEVDFVQLTPVALYNFMTFDQMPEIPPADQYDPESPPPSVIAMSLGADMSDLVVSNGYKVWQRTVNLGGNHFTKALTKQMKLTFAKAEHLKRNAMKAEDPKAVFQAMRPVFGELLGEVQRSLSFFQNLERSATLGRVLALGNAMKLRGLHKYLAQNLGLEVAEIDSYKKLTGPAVTASPAFKENMLSFAVCYGLCVQGLGMGRLSTNLLPGEIKKDRMIRAKKPWAVAAVAILMLACTVGFAGAWREWDSARIDTQASKDAFSAADGTKKKADDLHTSYDDAKKQFDDINKVGEQLAGIGDRRVVWAEMLKAVNDCLPRDPPQRQAAGAQPKEIPVQDRNIIYVDSIDCQFVPDLSAWSAEAIKKMAAPPPAAGAGAVAGGPGLPGATPGAPAGAAPAPAPANPTPAQDGGGGDQPPGGAPANGGAWIIHIVGHHYHNKSPEGAEYLRQKFLKPLNENDKLVLGDTEDGRPIAEGGKPVAISTKQLGITTAVLTSKNLALQKEQIPIPGAAAAPGAVGPGMQPAGPQMQTVDRFNFAVEFAWKPTPLSQRQAAHKEDAERKKAEATQEKVAADNGAK
ncbi:MAG TPA: type IV pilus assembly protein PilM [Pirellulales bacterium]|jgi:type IV pilus assembly protein PilM